jgi:AcrR family transcriptional regulator
MAESADTPTAILACAAELLRASPFDDISYRALGLAAGVSERTVYRQYPTRSHLLEALARWIEEREFALAPFVTLREFEAAVRRRFHDYDTSPAFAFVCARAAAVSPTAEIGQTFFTRAIEAMLATQAPALNHRDLQRLTATLRAFSSAQFWSRMRIAYEMDAADIADVFERTVAAAVGASGIARPVTALRAEATR